MPSKSPLYTVKIVLDAPLLTDKRPAPYENYPKILGISKIKGAKSFISIGFLLD